MTKRFVGVPTGVRNAVDAPTTTSGAVSPMARETAKMVPVRMPGRALGST